MNRDVITEFSWGVALWLFRCFCIAWLALVALLAARGVVQFLH